jgi:hypothetical protein
MCKFPKDKDHEKGQNWHLNTGDRGAQTREFSGDMRDGSAAPATVRALKRESHSDASKGALSRQAKEPTHQKTAAQRGEIGKMAARTRMARQSHAQRGRIAKKAARTRTGR